MTRPYLHELIEHHRLVNDMFLNERDHPRMRPTTPPPPLRADLSQRATELRIIAQQILARANELDQIAERM